MTLHYDAILSYLGEFGPYQKQKVVLISLIGISNALHACSVVFNMMEPPFRCAVPGLQNDTFLIQHDVHKRLVETFIPWDSDTGLYSQCEAYSGTWNGSDLSVNANQTVQCQSWVYDPAYSSSSAVPDWDLVCHQKHFKAHFNLMIMLGLLIGSFCGGTLADYFGRKKVLVSVVVLQSFFGMGVAFVTSPFGYMALRFTLSFTCITVYLTAFVLLAEIVGPSKRTLSEMLLAFGWCVGLFALVLICFCVTPWRISQLIISVPWILVISYLWLLDESPRWLIMKGHQKQARAVIEKIAKVNKCNVPDERELASNLDTKEEPKVEEQKLWHLCVSRVLVVRLIILALGWCTSSMVYFGLTLNVGTLIEGDIYVNFTVQSVLETVAYVVCMLLLDRVGRKTIYCASLLLSGFACLAMTGPVFAQTDIRWISLLLFSLGKFGITVAFTLVYIVTTELLPTPVRNSGLGFCSFLGRIAGTLSPYIAALGDDMSGDYGTSFPLFVFGLFGIMAGLTALILPESRNRKLPETIEDCKNFGRTPKENVIYIPSKEKDTNAAI